MDLTVPQQIRTAVHAADTAYGQACAVAFIEAFPQGQKIEANDGSNYIRTNRIHDGFCNCDTGELCSSKDIVYKHGGMRQPVDPLPTLPAIPRGAHYDERVSYVMEQCYQQLVTDRDLQTGTSRAAYVTLTNMLAAVLDERGSPLISLDRRFAYRFEAAKKSWSGIVTP